ncbi:MAG: YdcH family protein [Alphaproteobacteria bacterium]|nr:YdcH family protein [Alphaproteobacteria bacterium]
MIVHSHEGNKAPRIEALRKKHETLSFELENERKKLSSSDLDMARLKKQKLQVKEELSELLQSQEKKSVVS